MLKTPSKAILVS